MELYRLKLLKNDEYDNFKSFCIVDLGEKGFLDFDDIFILVK